MARHHLLDFTKKTMPNFKAADFHVRYYNKLDEFAKGKIRKLMVFMPPQHGKSEGSTRRLPCDILGINPDTKIGVISYSATKAKKFNREIQRIIDSDEYRDVFPDTTLEGPSSIPTKRSWARTTDECEIVEHAGSFKTVGVGGPLTGDPIDVLIMDDLYKDAKDAWSPVIRQNVSDWYDTVADTRLHNDSRQLIVFTRWHEEDLAGRLLESEGVYDADDNPNGWVVVVYKAIKEGKPTEDDPREEGEALWPEKHSIEQLEASRRKNPQAFESLYQQDPKPSQGLMYTMGFREYSIKPATKYCIRKSYTDTADTGADYLCSIIYDETEIGNFVIDIQFTTKPMEYTEPELAKLLTKYCVSQAIVESNNGGRSFARSVEQQCRTLNNFKTRITWFTQTENKATRIYTRSAEVQNMTYMPQGWIRLFPSFAKAILGYLKTGQNKHDDAPDALTGTIEKRGDGKSTSNVASLFGR